jgi:hypothetical protein
MGKRKNLVHQKVRNANPNDMIAFQVRIPAYLLKNSVTTYGSTAKIIRTALEMVQGRTHINNLVELISDIKKNLELLEEDKSLRELDEVIETYRDVYLRLKGAEVLRRRRRKV